MRKTLAIRIGFGAFKVAIGGVLILHSISSITPQQGEDPIDLEAPRSFRAAAYPETSVVGDFNNDGRSDIAVTNSFSASVTVMLNLGTGELASGIVSPAGTIPVSAAAADFNQDGRLDLAVANRDTRSVTLLRGVGDGSFLTAGSLVLPSEPQEVATADFNGDGNRDLLARSGSYVSVFLGNESGTFGTRSDVFSSIEPILVSGAGDLTEDGLDDVIAETSYRVGRSDGTFGPFQSFPPFSGANSVRVLDLDANHRPDVVFTTASNELVIFMSLGGGSFAPAVHVPAGQVPMSVAPGDFDEDGHLDLAVGRRFESDNIAIFRGDGQGGFTMTGGYRTGLRAAFPSALDLDGDGHLDLAVVLPDGINLVVLRGKGDGSFQSAPTVGGAGWSMTVADYDQDGHLDLAAVADGGTEVQLSRASAPGAFDPPRSVMVGGQGAELESADFNGDGLPDLAVLLRSDYVSILLNAGGNVFESPRLVFTASAAVSLQVADVDLDGNPDLIVSGRSERAIVVLPGDGTGGFGAGRRFPIVDDPTLFRTGDFNGDGFPDIALETNVYQIINFVSQRVAGDLVLLLGDGTGGFAPPTSLGRVAGFRHPLAAADVDGDARPDLILATDVSGTRGGQSVVQVLPGDGVRGFGQPRLYDAGNAPVRAVVHDLDDDGNVDLALVNVLSADVSVLRADGTGGFVHERAFAAGSRPVDIAAGDFDEDGLPDLAVADARHGVILLFNSTGENEPPAAEAGPDVTAECASAAGTTVTLDGSASSDPDSSSGTHDDISLFEWFEHFGQPSQTSLGTGQTVQVSLSLGVHLITLRVTDRQGKSDVDDLIVTVLDSTPAVLAVRVQPDALWPPNHRMVDVRATVQVSDACGLVSYALVGITSDEPDDAAGKGDGHTLADIQGAQLGSPDLEVALRAERDGGGPGRSYTLTYRALDDSGNAAVANATVTVSHPLALSPEPLILQVRPSWPGTLVAWEPVLGATSYDVIRGRLDALSESDDAIVLGPVVFLDSGLPGQATTGGADPEVPEAGRGFFYLVQYNDGVASSFGTVGVSKPRVPGPLP